MKEQTSVLFRITSPTLSAKEMEARIGLKPDDSWKAGQPRGAFSVVEKSHGFVLETQMRPSDPLDEHVKAMFKRLEPCAQKIGALGDASVEFVCTLHRDRAPRLRFGRDDLRCLGVMGARLDVDLFIHSDAPAKAPPPAPGKAS